MEVVVRRADHEGIQLGRVDLEVASFVVMSPDGDVLHDDSHRACREPIDSELSIGLQRARAAERTSRHGVWVCDGDAQGVRRDARCAARVPIRRAACFTECWGD